MTLPAPQISCPCSPLEIPMYAPFWLRSLARDLGLHSGSSRKARSHRRPARWTAGRMLRLEALEDRVTPSTIVAQDIIIDETPGLQNSDVNPLLAPHNNTTVQYLLSLDSPGGLTSPEVAFQADF